MKVYKNGNNFKKIDWSLIKEYLNRGYSAKDTKKLSGWSNSTIYLADHTDSFEDYREYNHKRFAKKSNGAVTSTPVHGEVKDINQVSNQDELESMIVSLDEQLESLKVTIEEVIVLSVDKRVEQYKKEKEAEIKSLKTVVEATKSSNLADSLKKRLMGAF